MGIEKRLQDWLEDEALKADSEMSLTAMEAEMIDAARKGLPVSVDLLLQGATMFHLRVEKRVGQQGFSAFVYRGFSLEAVVDEAVVSDLGLGIALCAIEMIEDPSMVFEAVLELEC
ncbi:protein of unknown function [Pseudodesulfovibrio profundus]|jgi:hypothetical protein|uniref:Uncharacterized protein n=1 Tax=Pseudodesulfovibrio profundus TaxID=57320 RepID=A0A2C8F628_9BACT|nr:hypothetical protein [Pseudodesulfovibrio profundus]SOB58015.1 protein of unknown function [Pseudodesulfovibrio profundus]